VRRIASTPSHQDLVARRVAHDAERVEVRHAGLDQRAEVAREGRDQRLVITGRATARCSRNLCTR
jgi:hypothetical protein